MSAIRSSESYTRVLCGLTVDATINVRGTAAPFKAIRIKINDEIRDALEPTDYEGNWARLVTRLEPGTEYKFIAVADYDDNPESDPWTINVLPSGNATED